LGGSPNLTLCINAVDVPALDAGNIELVNISLWVPVGGSNLTFGVKPRVHGQLIDVMIICSHQVYDFSGQLDDFSLLQFGKINLKPFDGPAHFWKFSKRVRNPQD
jgi:hypothetical protein